MAEYIDKRAIRDALYDADAITMKGVALLNQFPVVNVQWIPVTERLPEQNGKYLAFALKEENMIDFYDGHWMLYGLDYRRYVTHWMRIPEPPKEET